MRRIIFSLLLIFSANSYAENPDQNIETFNPIIVSNLYDKSIQLNIDELINLVEKEEKVKICVDEYIKKQSKSYAKIVQNNLYDLIHNFDKVSSRVYGKKSPIDNIPYDEKIEALAKVQCEAYFAIGILN